MNSIYQATEMFYFNFLQNFLNSIEELYYQGEIQLKREEKTIADLKSKFKKKIESRFKTSNQFNTTHPPIFGERISKQTNQAQTCNQQAYSNLNRQQVNRNYSDLDNQELYDLIEKKRLQLLQDESESCGTDKKNSSNSKSSSNPNKSDIESSSRDSQFKERIFQQDASDEEFHQIQDQLQQKQIKSDMPAEQSSQEESSYDLNYSNDSSQGNDLNFQSKQQQQQQKELNYLKYFHQDDLSVSEGSDIQKNGNRASDNQTICLQASEGMNYCSDLSQLSEEGEREIINDLDLNQVAAQTEESYLYGNVSRIQIPRQHKKNKNQGGEALRIYNFQLSDICGRINGLDVIFNQLKITCKEKY